MFAAEFFFFAMILSAANTLFCFRAYVVDPVLETIVILVLL